MQDNATKQYTQTISFVTRQNRMLAKTKYNDYFAHISFNCKKRLICATFMGIMLANQNYFVNLPTKQVY